MFMWKYKVHGYDGENEYTEEGVTCGESFVDAMKEIETYYGKDIIDVSLEYASDAECGVYVLNTTVQN